MILRALSFSSSRNVYAKLIRSGQVWQTILEGKNHYMRTSDAVANRASHKKKNGKKKIGFIASRPSDTFIKRYSNQRYICLLQFFADSMFEFLVRLLQQSQRINNNYYYVGQY